MARIKSQFDKLQKELKSSLKTGLSKAAMRRIGLVMIKIIVARVRTGKSVARDGGPQTRFKRLSPSYIKQRRRRATSLDRTTSPSKSNLTYSGIMLRSMTVKQAQPLKVVIGPNKVRRKGGLTNEKIAEIVSKVRPFNFLSKRELDEVTDVMEKEIQKAVKNNRNI